MVAWWVVGLLGCRHVGVEVAPVPVAASRPSDAVIAAMAHTWTTGCGAGGDAAACEAVVEEARWAARLAPDLPEVRHRLAAVLEGAGRGAEARVVWLAIADRWPDDAVAAWGVGRTTPGPDGDAALQRAIDGGADGARASLAARWAAAGAHARAETLLVAWVPADADARRARVQAAAGLGRWDLVLGDGAAALSAPAPDPEVVPALLAAAAAVCRPDVTALVRTVAGPFVADPRWLPFVDVPPPVCDR